MSQATYGIAITAKDQTGKGVASAQKRIGQLPKGVARSSGAAVRTLGAVESAAARAFGGKSITSGFASRLGAVRQAAAGVGEGLGQAATAGSALEGALTGIGVVAGATIGILAAAGYAAFKLVDGWSKGAAAIGRTADTIGVATKELQKFQAAGERAGVDKGASTSALGSIAETLNDAEHGRNGAAIAVLTRLGLKIRHGADGQIDPTATALDIADAIKRQHNPQSRRLIAKQFGISDAALPMFLQGAAPIREDMADAEKHAGVIDDEGIDRGRRIARKGVIVGQMKDRAMNAAGEAAAGVAEGGYDGVIKAGRYVMDGSTSFSSSVHNEFAPGARTIGHAADKMDRAADRMERSSYAGNGAGRLSRQGVLAEASRAARLRNKLLLNGFSRPDADALAANSVRESGADYQRSERGGHGYGLFQWTNKKRKDDFQRLFGHSIYQSSEDEQIRFLKWELANTEKKGWNRAHSGGDNAADIAAGFALHVERMKDKRRDPAERAAVADALSSIPVHVTVEMKGAPAGTRTNVRAGHHSAPPAVSRAFAFEPVHGG